MIMKYSPDIVSINANMNKEVNLVNTKLTTE